MMIYEHNDFWQPMDTYRDHQLLNQLYDGGQAPWVLW
jgi:glucose-1-phosphate cytidylyltransferase